MNYRKTIRIYSFIGVLLAAFVFFLLPAGVQAAAQFNNHPSDVPTVQVSNHTNNPGCTSCWATSVSADPGDIISVQVYYHNTGPDDAYNTEITLSPQNTVNGSQHIFSGGVDASNASPVFGNATVYINGSQTQSLSYIPGATNWYPNQTGGGSPTPFPYGQNGSEAFSSGLNIGTVAYVPPSGWSTQGVVVFNFRVSENQAQNPPIVNTHPATNIGTTSATLNGEINGNGGSNTNYWFEYGQGTSLGNSTNTTSVSSSGTVQASKTITGLTSGTTYSFRIMGQNSYGTVSGQTLTFTTGQQAPQAPDVTTDGHTNVSATSATLLGTVDTNGTSTTVHFRYGTSQFFGNQSGQSTYNSGTNSFSKTITGLLPNTTYYYQAYAQNTAGLTDTGVTKSFTTDSTGTNVFKPTVQTNAASNISQTAATLNGSVLSTGGENVSRYFKWGTNQFTLSNTLSISGTAGTGPFQRLLQNLNTQTTYYYQACATNSAGQDCGSVESFTTSGVVSQIYLPDVQTRVVASVTTTSAQLRGRIIDLGGDPNGVDRHFEWGTNPNSLFSTLALAGMQTFVGNFDKVLLNLSPNTTYYYRSCATNSAGKNCGSVESFNTNSNQTLIGQPEAQTRTASSITENAALLRGAVIDTGGDPSGVDRYFRWGTSINSLNNTLALSGVQAAPGNFDRILTGLNEDTVYYYRACAENSVGDHCGDIKFFRTQDTGGNVSVPDVRTRSAVNITDSTARLRGELLDDGNDPDGVDRYFEWGEDINDLDFTLILPGTQSNTGNFDRLLTGLDEDTRYYYRACVENSAGQDCGSVESFRTDDDDTEGRPLVETENATQVTTSSARLNGYLDANGDSTQYYFEYGTNSGLLSSRTTTRSFGLGDGDVNEHISGLKTNTTYYFRLRGWNDHGTEYGSIRSFRTDGSGTVVSTAPVAITGQASLISQNSARLNGLVLNRGGETLQTYFQWGRTTGLGTETVRQTINSEVATVSFNVFGLSPNTTYYYRIVATGSSVGTLHGDIVPFRTDSSGVVTTPPSTPPQVIVRETGGSGLPPLVDLDIEADFENVGPGETVTYTVTWKNITGSVGSDGRVTGGTIVTDSVLRIILPQELDYIRASRGTFSDTGHALTYEIGTLAPQQEGGLSLQVSGNRGILSAEPPIVTTANLAFQRPDVRDGNGNLVQNYPDDVIDYVLHNLSNRRTVGLAGLAFFSGFFPNTFFGWLLIAILILIIILIARQFSKRKEETPIR